MTPFPPPPADGHVLRWCGWDGDAIAEVSLRWENEAWTIEGLLHGVDVQYVLRLNASWRVQQFMLFRDLDEPDLWLATDGAGRWGEVNGAHRVDLDGCTDIDIALTPLTDSIVIRRLPLEVGHAAEMTVALVDVETLGVTKESKRYSRLAPDRWLVEWASRADATAAAGEMHVDEHGFALDVPGQYRRLS